MNSLSLAYPVIKHLRQILIIQPEILKEPTVPKVYHLTVCIVILPIHMYSIYILNESVDITQAS